MEKRRRRMSGSNSAGEKRPEPGGASIEQMADSSQRTAIEGAGKPADDAPDGQNKNEPMTAPPARASQPKKQRAGDKEAFLDRSLQKQIGSVLRDSFADIEKEALPERLQELIKALQAKEQSRR
jgi:hypothetical protein